MTDLQPGMNNDIPSFRRPEAAQDRVVALCGDVSGLSVLDVGCGDGLVGRALLPHVGPGGSVTFIDHDAETIEKLAKELPSDMPCQATVDNAVTLHTIEDDTVNLIVMRAVLLYVAEKRRALESAARVLREGGRIIISEPVNRPLYDPAVRFWGFDLSSIPEIAAKLQRGFMEADDPALRAMLDWDDGDLVSLVSDSGFMNVRMETFTEISQTPPVPWLAFLHARWTPWMPSLAKVISERLSIEEATAFERAARPQLAAGLQRMTIRNTFIIGTNR